MTLDFGGVKLLVIGDVCEDVMIVGYVNRLSRETPGLPVVDVDTTLTIQGGASAAYRQAGALSVGATLIPTSRSPTKTRLFAMREDVTREVARWDEPWPLQDAQQVRDLVRSAGLPGNPGFNGLLYSQVRPGRPLDAIGRLARRFKGFRLADARHPAYFAGLDALKIGMDDAWASLQPPRPRRTAQRAGEAAESFSREYGYRLAVVTMGPEGYAASVDGATLMEKGLAGGRHTSGAGDVFAATLACALTANVEARHALHVANVAAGIASGKVEHLASVSLDELREHV